MVPGCDPELSSSERSVDRYFRTECFTTPAPFTFGNAGRNILRGPGTSNLDLSLFKTVYINTDRHASLQFRAEFFNIFNRPQFNNPNASIGSAEVGTISSAGSPRSFQRTPRNIQLVFKLLF